MSVFSGPSFANRRRHLFSVTTTRLERESFADTAPPSSYTPCAAMTREYLAFAMAPSFPPVPYGVASTAACNVRFGPIEVSGTCVAAEPS